MKVRASPMKIDLIRKHFPTVHIEALSEGSYSVQNIEGTKLIAFLKEQGMVLEQQDALLIIKDVAATANTVVSDPQSTPAPVASPPAPKQAAEQEPETPKTAVYEHLDQAFTGLIQGMLAPKFLALEKQIGDISKSLQALTDRYDVGKTQLEASIQNAERQAKDASNKMTDAAQKVKTDIEDRLAQFKTEMESEINTIDDSLKRVNTQLTTCVAAQETNANAANVTSQTNLEEHKKMQENLARIAKHFQEIPLPK